MDFDTVIDRADTLSLKWDNPGNAPGLPTIIPLWVADMDFPPPPAVVDAIRRRAEHPIFGYTLAPKEYFEAVGAWYSRRQGLELGSDEILLAPAVMPSIAAAIHAFTERGDGLMIMPPVYHPFFSVIEENGRVVVPAPLARGPEGSWSLDFEGMGRAADRAAKEGIKLRAILFSSPHNPVGRVWTKEELEALVDFAAERGLTILCDEIHSDLILGERPFLSLASFVGPRAEGIVVLSGPNKTFNIAGLHICQAIARGEEVRQSMRRAISAWGFGLPNAFSIAAATAAYREGGQWLDELLGYLRGNLRFLSDFLARQLPGMRMAPLEGSYLAWLDVRSLLSPRADPSRDAAPSSPARFPDDAALARALEEKGRVKVSPGSGFGAEGSGYLRLNLACPRSVLAEALHRIAPTLR